MFLSLLPSFALAALQSPQPGHTLVAPFGSFDTNLVDEGGNVIHTWPGTALPGNATYLRENGNLVRMYKTGGSPASVIGGSGGGVQEIAYDGTIVWDFQRATATELLHHDMALMPNGNVLLLCFEDITRTGAIAMGRNPALTNPGDAFFWSEKIIELDPETLTVVWEWRLADHLVQDFDPGAPNFDVIANRPERLDLNFPGTVPNNGDWIHSNAMDYNPVLDQIVLSSPFLNEIWVIDHSTTTAEAAGTTGGLRGKGGDLLYRWGNPQAYDAGVAADQTLWNQHDIQWIPEGRPGAGNLLVQNNGNGRPGGPFSSADEWAPPILPDGTYSLTPGTAYDPPVASWSWQDTPPTDYFSSFVGGVERMPNGNTLIIEGSSGSAWEVEPGGTKVWNYSNPSGTPLFKARRYQKFLFPGDATLSAAVGGSLNFDLQGGNTLASRPFVLRAQVSPGPAGLRRTIASGVLDATGFATATLNTGGALPPAASGRSILLRWNTTAPNDFASDVISVVILP